MGDGDGMSQENAEELPELDEFGVLRHHGSWVALSPVQESLMRRLLARFGLPVPRQQLRAEVWPESASPRTIDAHMFRLRDRIQPLGLFIHTIRGRGFILAPAQPSTNDPRNPTWPIS
jgi:DNA-binding response OmpR family regulator